MTDFPRLVAALHESDVRFIVVGGGGWDALMSHTIEIPLFGRATYVLDLPHLIHVKRAAGRPKDLDALAELEVLLEERQR